MGGGGQLGCVQSAPWNGGARDRWSLQHRQAPAPLRAVHAHLCNSADAAVDICVPRSKVVAQFVGEHVQGPNNSSGVVALVAVPRKSRVAAHACRNGSVGPYISITKGVYKRHPLIPVSAAEQVRHGAGRRVL